MAVEEISPGKNHTGQRRNVGNAEHGPGIPPARDDGATPWSTELDRPADMNKKPMARTA